MGIVTAALKALYAAFTTFNSERAIYNQAPIVKAAVQQHIQDHADKLAQIHAVLANVNATADQKAAAIQALREEDSAT